MGIKLGLVGLGVFGSAFVPLFKSHPGVDAIALCDADPEKLRKWAEDPRLQDKLQAQDCYTSFDEICRSDVDALVVITQHWLHAPQCLQALQHGKSVYSAVPVICLPDFDEMLDWCQQLIDAEQKSGRYYMLGETTIYRPQTMFCRRQAAQNLFGDFVYAEGEYAHDLDIPNCSLREVIAWRSKGEIGKTLAAFEEKYLKRGIKGSPMNYPTHSISGPMKVMNSRALKVSACGFRNRTNDPFFAKDHFSNVTALYHLENGAALRIAEYREISENIGCKNEDFRIFGTRGSYSYNIWCDNSRVIPDGKYKPNVETRIEYKDMFDRLPQDVADAYNMILNKDAKKGDDFTPDGHGGSHPYLVHEFVSSIIENRRPEITIYDAANWTSMAAAAHESALKDGETIKIQQF